MLNSNNFYSFTIINSYKLISLSPNFSKIQLNSVQWNFFAVSFVIRFFRYSYYRTNLVFREGLLIYLTLLVLLLLYTFLSIDEVLILQLRNVRLVKLLSLQTQILNRVLSQSLRSLIFCCCLFIDKGFKLYTMNISDFWRGFIDTLHINYIQKLRFLLLCCCSELDNASACLFILI